MGPELRKRILTRYPSWHRQPLKLNLEEMEDPLSVARTFFDIYNLTDIRACLRFWMEEVSGSDSIADHLVTADHLEKLVEAAWVWNDQQASSSRQNQNCKQLPFFDRIENHLPCNITLKQGKSPSISPYNESLIHLTVRGNVLRLSPLMSDGNHPWPESLLIECPLLKSIFSSAGVITSEGILEVEGIRIDQEGRAGFSLSLNAVCIEIVMQGSGKLDISGSCQSLGLHTYGSGAYEGPELHAKAVSLRICGTGPVVIAASQKIEGLISSGNVVYYKGKPTMLQVHTGEGSALLEVNAEGYKKN